MWLQNSLDTNCMEYYFLYILEGIPICFAYHDRCATLPVTVASFTSIGFALVYTCKYISLQFYFDEKLLFLAVRCSRCMVGSEKVSSGWCYVVIFGSLYLVISRNGYGQLTNTCTQEAL